MQHTCVPLATPRPWRSIARILCDENTPKRILDLVAELTIAVDEQVVTCAKQSSALPLGSLMRRSDEVIRRSEELIAQTKVLARESREAIKASKSRVGRL
jgi:hypothetical protein